MLKLIPTNLTPFLSLFLVAVLSSPLLAFSQELQEMHIYNNAEIHLIGADLANRNALNYLTVGIWGQKFAVEISYVTLLQARDGKKISPTDLQSGHKLEIKGKLTTGTSGNYSVIDARSIQDLSMGDSPSPAVAAVSLPLAPPKISSAPEPVINAAAKPAVSSKALTRYLALGMRGPEVITLQEFLQKNSWGIPDDGPVTGYFGKVTRDSLKKFQQVKGLEAVGTVGPKTRELINKALLAR